MATPQTPGHLLFDDELHESLAAHTALGMVSHGGGEPGEIISTCARIADGDDASWFSEWSRTAELLTDLADT